MLLEPFDAKEFAPNRFFSDPEGILFANFKTEMWNASIWNAFVEYELHESHKHSSFLCGAAPKTKRDGGEENENFCPAFLSKEPTSRLLIVTTMSERKNMH